MANGASTTPARSAPSGRRVTYEVVRQLGLALPGVEESLSYGTPALKINGKLIARLKEDGESLVIRIGFLERQALMESDPAVFYITDHYLNYPAMLVRLSKVRRDRMRRLLEDAWARLAPKRLVSKGTRREGRGTTR